MHINLNYPVLIQWDEDTFVATLPDIPEAVADGESVEQALHNMREAIEACLQFRIEEGEEIPEPSSIIETSYYVRPSAIISAKVLLYKVMRQQKVTKAELARRLGWPKAQVHRLLDWGHHSRFDQFTKALSILGVEMIIGVADLSHTKKSETIL